MVIPMPSPFRSNPAPAGQVAPPPVAVDCHCASQPGVATRVYGLVATASSLASAFHGYRRNDSLAWALVWGAAGAVLPLITPTIALAQGFGKPASPKIARRERGYY